MDESAERFSRLGQLRGEEMRTPDEVAAMLRLRALGWGERRIARELGCSRKAVRRYLAADGWVSYRTARRVKKLDGLEEQLNFTPAAERSDLIKGYINAQLTVDKVNTIITSWEAGGAGLHKLFFAIESKWLRWAFAHTLVVVHAL